MYVDKKVLKNYLRTKTFINRAYFAILRICRSGQTGRSQEPLTYVYKGSNPFIRIMNLQKHPKTLKLNYSTVDDLISDIGNLKYDSAIEILKKMGDEYQRQANADLCLRNRIKLATALYQTARKCYETADELLTVWNICEPYMSDDN